MTSADFLQNITTDFQALLDKNEPKALGGIDIFLKSYQEKFVEIKSHLQNLENNFDLVVREGNLSEGFKFIKNNFSL